MGAVLCSTAHDEIWDVVIGVVGCFALVGLFSLIKRLGGGMVFFLTKLSRPWGPDINDLGFENEHPLIGAGPIIEQEHSMRGGDPDPVDRRFARDTLGG